MPEAFQDGYRGEAMQSNIGIMKDAINNLDSAADELEQME